MSRNFNCDFCGKKVEHRKAGRPQDWGKAQIYKTEGYNRMAILTIDACPDCKAHFGETLDKPTVIDLLRRLHIMLTSPNKGDR